MPDAVWDLSGGRARSEHRSKAQSAEPADRYNRLHADAESWSAQSVADAIPAIIAVAGTLLGSALTYLFQSIRSKRAEASAFQRELRADRLSAYSSYSTALTEFRRGQLDWYNRRKEDPKGEVTLAARIESYRLRGIAETALSRVRLVASDPALVSAAKEAYELTRPVHYAQDSADLDSRTEKAKEAVDRFVALAAAEFQSAPAA
jgi:hypothetical protein